MIGHHRERRTEDVDAITSIHITSGNSCLTGCKSRYVSDPTGYLDRAMSQLEQELIGHLDEAHARQGTAWRAPQAAASAPGQINPAASPAVYKALSIAQTARDGTEPTT